MMDLTTFKYITELPEVITNEVWFEFAVRCYNLGLTAVWLLIAFWLFNTFFTCFSKAYHKGHE